MSSFDLETMAILAQKGLKVDTNTVLNRNLFFRGPVCLKNHTHVVNSLIDAFTVVYDYSFVCSSQVGRYCTIGERSFLGLVQHDLNEPSTCNVFARTSNFNFAGFSSNRPTTFFKTRNNDYFSHVRLNHDVYVGTNVLFPSDLEVGSGAIIKSGAVITKDIPPYAIVEGNNRIVGYRFSDELISDFLELQWWNYNLPEMFKRGVVLPRDNPREFVSRFKDLSPEHLISLDDTMGYLILVNKNPSSSIYNLSFQQVNIKK